MTDPKSSPSLGATFNALASCTGPTGPLTSRFVGDERLAEGRRATARRLPVARPCQFQLMSLTHSLAPVVDWPDVLVHAE